MKPERIFLPLAVMDAADRQIRGRTKMQKFVFLIQQELDQTNAYSFIPYDYGPFTSSLAADLDEMEEEGMIEERENDEYGYEFKITKEGRKELQDLSNNLDLPANEIRNKAQEIVENWNKKPLSVLLNHVYSEYPEYAENSVL